MKLFLKILFSGGLGRFNKMTEKFKLKDNIQPVFKKQRNAPFVSLPQINDELDSLERTGFLSKIVHSQCASPTVYARKKSRRSGSVLISRRGLKLHSKTISILYQDWKKLS